MSMRSAESRVKTQRDVVNNIDRKIQQCEKQAAFDNSKRDVVDTYCKQADQERELVDEKLEGLKKTLDNIKEAKDEECYTSFPQEIHHRLKKKWATCECPKPDTFGGLEVPKNIEHAFRTQQVSELLSDPEQVQQAVKANEAQQQKQVKSDMVAKMRGDIKIPSGDSIYYELSSALRSSTFPGYSWDQTSGLEKSTYTNDVFKKQAAIAPRPDSQEAKNLERYKYKADEFTRWRESFFLREQQAKKWATVQADKKAGNK